MSAQRFCLCFLTRWSKIKILVLTTCFLYTRDRVAKYLESELLVLLSQQIRHQTFGKTKTAPEKGRKSLQKVHPPCQKNLWVRNISSLTPYSSSTQGSFADIHRLFQQKIGYSNIVREAQVREWIVSFVGERARILRRRFSAFPRRLDDRVSRPFLPHLAH